MSNLNILIDELNNKNSEIAQHSLAIISFGGFAVSGIAMSGLDFKIGNQWTTVSDLTGQASDKLIGGAQVVQGLIGKIREKLGNSDSIKNQATYVPIFAEQYRELWKGPEKPQFSVKLLFINYKGNDVRKEVLSLYRSVLPGGAENPILGKDGGSLLKTPLGYNAVQGGKGTVALKIGKWFKATGLLVENVQSDFSKDVSFIGDPGSNITGPLYADVTVSLRPWQAVLYSEFLGYFTGLSTDKKGNII